MVTRLLARPEWHFYFERLAKAAKGKRALIEVTGIRLGDQIAAKWVPLIGITYDQKNDLLEIAMVGFDHLVHKPSSISVEEGPEGLQSLEIIGADQLRQIVRLGAPLKLPEPEH